MSRRRILSIALLVLAGCAAYQTAFGGAFVFDDHSAIINNPHVRTLWPLSYAAGAPPNTPLAGRPVVSLSFAVNFAISGGATWSYHALNVAIHVLAGLTLYGVMRRALLTPRWRERFGSSADGIALCVALIWLVHPLQTESVTYIVQRAESLVGLLYLLTVYCLLRGAEGPNARRWNIACVAACAFGMATKEVMATAPVVCLLIDRAILSGSFARLFKLRWRVYAGLAATWCVLAIVLLGSPRSQTAGFSNEYVTAAEYAATQPGVILHYLRLAFWPDGLCLDYWWPIARTAREIVPGAIVLGLLLLATLVLLWRNAPAALLGAWFFFILAPSSSFVPIKDAAFEHRMYLPLAGVIAAVVVAGWSLLRRAMPLNDQTVLRTRIAAVVVGVIAIALVGATRQRNLVYHDQETLWRDVLAQRPDNPRARTYLGTVLRDKGDLDAALAEYRQALAIAPDDIVLLNNIGAALAQKAVNVRDEGRAEDAAALFQESITFFRRVIELAPDHPIARVTLGNVLREMGDYAAAEVEHRKAIELTPDYGDAHYNLGLDLEAQGRVEEAIAAYREALRLHPSHWMAEAALKRAGQQKQ